MAERGDGCCLLDRGGYRRVRNRTELGVMWVSTFRWLVRGGRPEQQPSTGKGDRWIGLVLDQPTCISMLGVKMEPRWCSGSGL
jgi:hypothetical protein